MHVVAVEVGEGAGEFEDAVDPRAREAHGIGGFAHEGEADPVRAGSKSGAG